jgi:hypothetical protein
MGSITNFISNIREVARPKLFNVGITIPDAFKKSATYSRFIKSSETNLKLDLKCESTNIPGRTFATTEQKFGSNPTEKHAYHTTYNDVDMTFIITEPTGFAARDNLPAREGFGLIEKDLFDEWMNWINPIDSYDFRYKKEYVSDIVINQFSNTGKIIFSCTLIDAFPISVNQLDLDWSSDGYHKLNVTFAYTRWTT